MDYYDKAVAYLTERPDEILRAWSGVFMHRAGKLFAACSHDRSGVTTRDGEDLYCGCPAQIRAGMIAETDELTKAIRADKRLPKKAVSQDCSLIPVESLPVFAEWQRRIDAELGRTPPVWVEDGEAETS